MPIRYSDQAPRHTRGLRKVIQAKGPVLESPENHLTGVGIFIGCLFVLALIVALGTIL